MAEEFINELEDDLFSNEEEKDIEKILFNGKPAYVQAMEDTLDWFKQEIKKGAQGLKTGFPTIDTALGGGLQAGLHLVAGESNHGKTAFLTQMAFNVAKLNGDVYVLDISLDDSLKEKIARVIASHEQIIINAVKDPIYWAQQYPGMVSRINTAVDDLKKMAWHYRAVDTTVWGNDVNVISEAIRALKVDLNAMSKPPKLIVFIDNFHDLTASQFFNSDKNKYEYIAQAIGDLATELDIPIVCTAELRKVNNQRRPRLDDIREAVKIAYEAKSVMMVYNDVGDRGEAASVYWNKTTDAFKHPVLEVHIAKNKFNDIKGRYFYEFHPEMAYFQEALPQDVMTYAQAVNNAMGV